MSHFAIKALFLDIGGVLLTNGWDRNLRKRALEEFGLEDESKEIDDRHHLVFDTFETGKIALEEYLRKVIFFKERKFTYDQFTRFILEAARSFPEMIAFIKEIKKSHGLKIAVVSNEGKELAVDRIHRFRLGDFVDFFVVSSFVHFRKPDRDIYRLALEISQVQPQEVVYIEDRDLLVEVANGMKFHGIHHVTLESTKKEINRLLEARASSNKR